MGKSFSDELGRNVNRSTSENTFVIRGDPFIIVVVPWLVAAGAFSFSFPLAVADAKARKKL